MNARVWGVSETKGDEVTKGQVTDTLLATHFRTFVYEDEDDDKWFKEAEELEVVAVPATDAEIGERQIVLTNVPVSLQGAFEKAPKKNEDEATYRTLVDGEFDRVYAYVPENVYGDLDELLGREVTVMFGKDNVVALIIVTNDDVVNNEYLTKYDDEEIAIGSDKYKFADGADVYVNNVKVTVKAVAEHLCDVEGCTDTDAVTLDTCTGHNYTAAVPAVTAVGAFETAGTGILATLEETEGKTFNKNVKANVVLNSKEKVTRLDLYVSGNFDAYLTKEAVVTEVKRENIKTSENRFGYNYKNIDEEDLPRVIKNGKTAKIEDIEVGDVLTVYVDENDKPVTIYASDARANGEVSRVSGYRVTIDGEAYYSSMKDKDYIYFSDEEIKDAEKWTADNAKGLLDEEVELFLNIYGEYVAVLSEDAGTEYQVAVVKAVRNVEETDDDDIYNIPLRLLLSDGNISKEYKLVWDADDPTATDADDLADNFAPGDVVAFKANSDKTIDEDKMKLLPAVVGADTKLGDHKVVKMPGYGKENTELTSALATITIDDKMVTVEAGDTDPEYNYTKDTIIYNVADANKPEVVGAWTKIVKNDNDKKVIGKAILLLDKDDEDLISYIIIEEATLTSTSAYATVVVEPETTTVDGSEKILATIKPVDSAEVELVVKDGEEDLDSDWLVEYTMSNEDLGNAAKILNVKKFLDMEDDTKLKDHVLDGIELDVLGFEPTNANITKEALQVRKINGYYFYFNDDTDLGANIVERVKLSEDVTVVDITSGTPEVVDMEDISTGDYIVVFENTVEDARLGWLVVIVD